MKRHDAVGVVGGLLPLPYLTLPCLGPRGYPSLAYMHT